MMNCRSDEKIICPWCGTEMRVCIDENSLFDYNGWTACTNDKCTAEGPMVTGFDSEEEAIEAARAAALHRYTPLLKPMTLVELMAVYDAREDHVWPHEERAPFLYLDSHVADNDNCWIPWCLVRDMVESGYRKYTRESYGKMWRLWERKPTDEERSAAEWET